MSIFLEAIQRLIQVPTISNPQLVLIVGCCGLASNIIGLFLFHDHGHGHGHSHGEDEHEHEHSHDELNAAEEGLGGTSYGSLNRTAITIADENGNVAEVRDTTSPIATRKHTQGQWSRKHNRSTSRGSRGIEELPTHPGSLRKHFLEAGGNLQDIDSQSGTDTENEDAVVQEANGGRATTENSPLLKKNGYKKSQHDHFHGSSTSHDDSLSHSNHNHAKPKTKKASHGHSHDMNARGVFLHVLGDALGNVGVISAALIIWLSDWEYRFYADPIISLIITAIILASAIPLCKGASRILLQAVPEDINVEDIREDITSLPGVVSCHHLHVWQLADQKHVASLHVQVDFDVADNCNEKYMNLARSIRNCLHAYGIHSSTIQPEFRTDGSHHEHFQLNQPDDDCEDPTPPGSSGSGAKGIRNSKTASVRSRSDTGGCLLECGNECRGKNMCCAPAPADDNEHQGDHHGHSH